MSVMLSEVGEDPGLSNADGLAIDPTDAAGNVDRAIARLVIPLMMYGDVYDGDPFVEMRHRTTGHPAHDVRQGATLVMNRMVVVLMMVLMRRVRRGMAQRGRRILWARFTSG
jgi:hypothetical protein